MSTMQPLLGATLDLQRCEVLQKRRCDRRFSSEIAVTTGDQYLFRFIAH